MTITVLRYRCNEHMLIMIFKKEVFLCREEMARDRRVKARLPGAARGIAMTTRL